MLQTIRDRAHGWIAWAIVFLISVPFALWGIQSYLDIGGEPIVKWRGPPQSFGVYFIKQIAGIDRADIRHQRVFLQPEENLLGYRPSHANELSVLGKGVSLAPAHQAGVRLGLQVSEEVFYPLYRPPVHIVRFNQRLAGYGA